LCAASGWEAAGVSGHAAMSSPARSTPIGAPPHQCAFGVGRLDPSSRMAAAQVGPPSPLLPWHGGQALLNSPRHSCHPLQRPLPTPQVQPPAACFTHAAPDGSHGIQGPGAYTAALPRLEPARGGQPPDTAAAHTPRSLRARQAPAVNRLEPWTKKLLRIWSPSTAAARPRWPGPWPALPTPPGRAALLREVPSRPARSPCSACPPVWATPGTSEYDAPTAR
jgi:hypothetical protein